MTDRSEKPWRPIYWAFSAVAPVCFLTLEAFGILVFETLQAPNVPVAAQLGLMFGFYGVWTFVPRLLWGLAGAVSRQSRFSWPRFMFIASGLAVLLSAAHLFLLAVILKYMHSPPGWGVTNLAVAFGEVWLSQAGVWLLAFYAAAGVVGWIHSRSPRLEPALKRYAIRQGGRLISMPLKEIIWISAAGNYSELHTVNGRFMERKTLADLEREFSGTNFLRAHRSALVNGEHVAAIKADKDTGNYTVQMTLNHEAPLSRRRLSAFKSVLKHIA